VARRRRSLLFWVALALTVAAAFPAAVGLLQLRSNRDALLDQVQRLQILSASTVADRLASAVARLRQPALAVARDPVLEDLASSAAHERLAELLQDNADLLAAAVVAPDGSTVVLAQRRDARERVALALAAPPEGEVEIGGAKDERWLQLRLPIVDREDHLALVAEAGDLEEVLQQANRVAGAETVVIDRSAHGVLGAPQIVAELPADLLAQVAAVQFTTGAGRYRDGKGEEVIAAHHAVAGTPWVVLSRQPQAAADAARRRLRAAALTATAGSALIAAMLSFFGYRLLVVPIQRLVRAQAQVAGVADPGGGSEIAQLESTFGQLLQLEKDRESIGEVFLGRYRVIGKLGKGGSGTVYKGFDPVLQRSVALKAVPLGAADGSEAEQLLSKLQEEAVHLARLNHPNIVTVFDFERRGDTAYIAMEMVDGVSLAKYLGRHGALAVRQATAIAVAMTDALAAAHGVELIHGDLKPGNILLGSDGSIKVADFGTAQLVRDANAEATKLEGTAGYLAPEVLKRKGATRASDLFSLGVVIYEMLAGARPFGKGSIGDVLKRTLRGDVEPLGAARPSLPPELSRLVMTLLATEPTARLESADQVADELALIATRLGGGELDLDFETVIGPASSEDLLSEDFVTRYLPDR
jgi:hypothetical protein